MGHAVAMRRRGPARAFDWLFRSRTTGRITIVQFPNAALWLFLIASLLRSVFDPAGSLGTALRVLATGGLIWWAVDEVVRGVNPWRRLLGGVVLAGQVMRFFS